MKFKYGYYNLRWWFIGFYIGESFIDLRLGPCYLTWWFTSEVQQ